MTPDTLDLPETTAPRPTPSKTPTIIQSPHDDTAETTRAKLLDLSLTQLIGGSMAAATAAALGSRLGVVGTIAGAAVGSVVTAIAASVYTGSMAKAREALVAARAMGRVPTAVTRPDWWRLPDRAGARRLLATTGVVFLVAVGFLAGLQLATGTPVTGTSIGTRQARPAVDAPREQADPDTEDRSAAPAGPATTGTPTGTGQPTTPAAPGAPAGSGSATIPAEPATPEATETGTAQPTDPVSPSGTPTPDGTATSTAAAG